MCPADITPDGGRSDENLSADASTSGGIPVAAFGAAQVSDEDRAPNYPPAQVIISIPMDGEPYIIEDGGLPDWLLAAGMARIVEVICQADRAEAWTVTFHNEEDDE